MASMGVQGNQGFRKKSRDLKLAPKRISQGREHERKTKFKSILIRMFGINERFVSLEWRR